MFKNTDNFCSQGDGWLSWLLRQLSGFESHISQKYKMGDISKGVANTRKPAKKIFKKLLFPLRTDQKKLLKLLPIAELRRVVVSTFYLDIATVLSSHIFPPSFF
jgi:hypothetical protein